MDITIRTATPADTEVVAEFNAALAWESEQKQLHAPTLKAGVMSLLADRNKGFYTLAESAGVVVGQTLITFEWSDWRNGWYWWIQSVYVRPESRKLGVFKSLFTHLQNTAMADPEVIGIRLYVERENDRARQIYEKLGMSEEAYFLYGMYPFPGRSDVFSKLSDSTI
jgi:ribosomal protein S18 acetylase RimI-like enzyme